MAAGKTPEPAAISTGVVLLLPAASAMGGSALPVVCRSDVEPGWRRHPADTDTVSRGEVPVSPVVSGPARSPGWR